MAAHAQAHDPHGKHGHHGDLSEHPGDPHDGAHGDHPSLLVYWTVFGLLMALLAAAVVVGFLIGGLFGTILSFVIGVAKAILIVLYFMHVRYGTRLTWIFAGASFIWLALLLGVTFNDYFTRSDQDYQGAVRSNRAQPWTHIVTTDSKRGPLDRP